MHRGDAPLVLSTVVRAAYIGGGKKPTPWVGPVQCFQFSVCAVIVKFESTIEAKPILVRYTDARSILWASGMEDHLVAVVLVPFR